MPMSYQESKEWIASLRSLYFENRLAEQNYYHNALEDMRYPFTDFDGEVKDVIVSNPMSYQECKEWIASLRSGKFNQGKDVLRYTEDSRTYFCCLGVEQRIHPKQCKSVTSNTTLRSKGDDSSGSDIYFRLPYDFQGKLAGMNDNGCTFRQIADVIELMILPWTVFYEWIGEGRLQ